MNKISKDLTSEKMAAEKLQKSNSGQLSQQVSDNRKLALEISKLKVSHSISVCALHVHRFSRLSYLPVLVHWQQPERR